MKSGMERREFLKLTALVMAGIGRRGRGQTQETPRRKPNIVIILADDLGYGDVGCYGNPVNKTPHIDALAAEGLRFTDFHANGAVCSPTRAALLTGRYQQRMGIEGTLGEGDMGLGGPQARNEITMSMYFREMGYRTGIMGKWHLGYGLKQSPIHFGFDEFRGMLHGAVDYHSHVNTFGRFDWWHNEKLSKERGYVTDLITDHSLRFIEAHRDKPFFLFVSHGAIHFPWQTPRDKAHREEGKRYRDVSGPLNRLGPHPPEKTGDVVRVMIEEVDKSVGRITAKLRELELDKQTLVFFASDNGGILDYRGGYTEISSNGPLRGAKGSVYEGGHRVPAIAWWPGKIKPGLTTHETAMTMDLMPTFFELANLALPAASGPNALDGISLKSLLFVGEPLCQRTLFWKVGNSRAIRRGSWKLVKRGDGSSELYDLETDVGERRNLAGSNPALVRELLTALSEWEIDIKWSHRGK